MSLSHSYTSLCKQRRRTRTWPFCTPQKDMLRPADRYKDASIRIRCFNVSGRKSHSVSIGIHSEAQQIFKQDHDSCEFRTERPKTYQNCVLNVSQRHKHNRLSPATTVFPASCRTLTSLWSQNPAMFQQKGFMLILTLIGVICSARLGFAATIPLAQPINPSPIDRPSVNERHHCRSSYRHPFHYHNEFSGHPGRRERLSNSRYASVSIPARSPPGGGKIQARYLLRRLYSGIRSTLQGNDRRLAEFTLLWDGAMEENRIECLERNREERIRSMLEVDIMSPFRRRRFSGKHANLSHRGSSMPLKTWAWEEKRNGS